MTLRLKCLALCAVVLTACTSIDGVYLPACEAYAGSKITLSGGRFHWSKFTDQVEIDDEGNVVEPFPGFPLEGDYEVSERKVTLTPDSGQRAETLYLLEEKGHVYLLTAREKAEMQAGGVPPKCALRRQSPGT
jgi:hypothetical protein